MYAASISQWCPATRSRCCIIHQCASITSIKRCSIAVLFMETRNKKPIPFIFNIIFHFFFIVGCLFYFFLFYSSVCSIDCIRALNNFTKVKFMNGQLTILIGRYERMRFYQFISRSVENKNVRVVVRMKRYVE